jgi:pimeloyl-ACP methyl ester carboxylesterase
MAKSDKTIYVLSGLGADKRVFQRINFGNHKVIFVDWIAIQDGENIKGYAQRIAEIIKAPQPILIGISFGGIVAKEIASLIEIDKLVLLSTIENRDELPLMLKILASLKVDRLIPSFILKAHSFIADYFFGVDTPANSEILKSILKDTDPALLKWSLRQIALWEAPGKSKAISKITIHGTHDKILPMNLAKEYNYKIKGAGHFLTLTHYLKINEILKHELLT